MKWRRPSAILRGSSEADSLPLGVHSPGCTFKDPLLLLLIILQDFNFVTRQTVDLIGSRRERANLKKENANYFSLQVRFQFAELGSQINVDSTQTQRVEMA